MNIEILNWQRPPREVEKGVVKKTEEMNQVGFNT
jgi:hypothetical protein